VLVRAKATDVKPLHPLLAEIGTPYPVDVLGGGEIAKVANNASMRATRLVATQVLEFAAACGLTMVEASRDHKRDVLGARYEKLTGQTLIPHRGSGGGVCGRSLISPAGQW
jgi:hypothetical protein